MNSGQTHRIHYCGHCQHVRDDYDLALKISKHTKILALPGKSHYLYRRYAGSVSATDPWAARETMRLLRQHKSLCLHKPGPL